MYRFLLPPVNVKVCPVLNVSFEPESALLIVNDDDTVPKLKLPEPSVFKNWSAVPSDVGYEIPSKTTLPLPFGVIVISPFVFSEVIALPSTFNIIYESTDHGVLEEPRGTELR